MTLRKGFTTGVCAAGGAKAATIALLRGTPPETVDVVLPQGGSLCIRVSSCEIRERGRVALAGIVKDGGDDPDVTNGIEIVTEVRFLRNLGKGIRIHVRGGEGVGVVTKPGLKIPPGRPAINPVPLRMIKDAVRSILQREGMDMSVMVIVSVPMGREVAKRTMNERLGIIGGISILGTTGIVEPLSLDAYRHSITCALDVASASGLREVVLSTGRGTERMVQTYLNTLPSEAFILVGDHMGFGIKETARRRGIRRLTVAGQFGKLTKFAQGVVNTHSKNASIDLAFLSTLCRREVGRRILGANTAREAYFILREKGSEDLFKEICRMVRKRASILSDGLLDTRCILAGYDRKIFVSG